ncbi:MAG: ABC transporter ATP-binding protein [Candidatus Auribacterota bacterium]|jgi:ABC-2 type transport system ATP-binding protein|uniref:ABC transporter ATP-binding protein n=1 Tax=Candidatus Auribacter fodinae TaxID=2093366 RepID=A0A3A4R257_9BACT|nr:MAG: ABC transporter ATP-binding protein [Candidatus Auribacter fodinae]
MADNTKPVVMARNLTKVFKDFWGRPRVKAVDDISFQINQGEVYGLLGPNGSGKSTTLKLLLGLLFPTKGQISILGKPVSHVAVKQRIGFLPEESYLYGYLSARETLEFYGKLFDLTAAQRKQRAEQLLDIVGLEKVASRPVREFSKGMARRLGLAQALINDPDLIFLDEPTSGLDPIGTRQIKDLISDLKQRGKTVLLCSHLLADVEDVCDRISILYGGKIKVEGKVSDLLQNHNTLQINMPDLKMSTIEKIKKVIMETENNPDISIEHPHDRLETFFLNVVEQAVKDKDETSGAQIHLAGKKEPEPQTADQNTAETTDTDLIKHLMDKE